MEEPSALIGHRIGSYEVLSLLGSGGMGDVYRARDARLHRDVALKVVRPSLTADPELMVRLEREARVLAFVHGNLSPDGDWLALPLIDGGTTNVWALPTIGGPMRPLTDFQGRSTLIARQVWWSPDGQFVYAAVAELGADVVMYDGLLSP